MNKLITILLTAFSLISLTALIPTTALAVNAEEEIIHSQVGDKVYEIDKMLFYAYGNNRDPVFPIYDFTPQYGGSANGCGPDGCSIPDAAAPANWKLSSGNDASWPTAQDSFNAQQQDTSTTAYNYWCLDPATSANNCHFYGTAANDPKQITGPSGFIDGETLLFRKSLTINPPAGFQISAIRLDVWSDNNSWVYLDGQYVAAAGLSNPTTYQVSNISQNTPTSISISPAGLGITNPTQSITKMLSIQVSNDWPRGVLNPIAVAYKVTAVYEPRFPTASVSITSPFNCAGLCSGQNNQAFIFTAPSNGNGNNLTEVSLYITRTASTEAWPYPCPNDDNNTDRWCRLKTSGALSNQATYTLTSDPWNPPNIGQSYTVTVNSENSANVNGTTVSQFCTGNPFVTGFTSCGDWSNLRLTVTVIMPPTIDSLQVNNANASQTGGFSGTYKVSGLQNTERGSNWLNPINITLNATGSDGQPNSTISEYYVAFYNKTGGLASATSTTSFLNDIQTRLNSNPSSGFLLKYNVTLNRHEVWETLPSPGSSKWSSIPVGGYEIKDFSSIPLLRISPNSLHSWKVDMFSAFGAKNMYTGASVVDNNTLTDTKAEIP